MLLFYSSIFIFLSFLGALYGEDSSSLEKSSSAPSNTPSINHDIKNQFSLSSPIEKLRIGGYMQIDGRLFLQENSPPSTLLLPLHGFPLASSRRQP